MGYKIAFEYRIVSIKSFDFCIPCVFYRKQKLKKKTFIIYGTLIWMMVEGALWWTLFQVAIASLRKNSLTVISYDPILELYC